MSIDKILKLRSQKETYKTLHNKLDSTQKETYEERLAILIYDGKVDIKTAEQLALIIALQDNQCLHCNSKYIINTCIQCLLKRG